MAITAVSGQFVATSGTSATAISGALPSAPTAGNLLVAMVDCAGLVTPTATGAWTKLTQIQSTDTGALFWKIVPGGDSATQTLTSSGTGSSWGVVIQEFAGATASPLLVENNQASTTTSKASPSVSPTAGLEALIVGGAFSDGTRTFSSSAFTGSNTGSVSNVGTGSRGAANTGESATLWYAQITTTSGSYSATITCSAADGGGAAVAVFRAITTRSLAGSQPASSGTLSQVQTRFRSLAGAQPALVAVQYADATTTYADLSTYYTGRSPGILVAEEAAGISRSVAGSQPTATGTLTRILTRLRELSGSQPTATGTLTRVLGGLRSVAGSQPTATGTLTRVLGGLRSVAGSQPTATGTLTRVLLAVRTIAGAQPTATGTLTRILGAVRSVAGSQPAPSGTLARLLAALRALDGAQPTPSGTLSAALAVFRSLAGDQPTATGTLVGAISAIRDVDGAQPAPTGTLTQQLATARAVAGDQPSPTGALTQSSAAFRALAGSQPAAGGTAAVVQAAGPVADLDDGSWTNEFDSTVNLYASIDEPTPSGSDYIKSSLSPVVVDEVRLVLAALDDPLTDTGHALHYQYRKDQPGGDQIDLTVTLYRADGTTVIAEQTHVDIEDETTAALVLTPAEAASIPSADYSSGLVLGFKALKV